MIDSSMRLLICAGGTGGGVYPAIAVLQALNDLGAAGDNSSVPTDIEVMWVGSVGGMEKTLVERVGIPFKGIPAAGVHGVGLRALPGNIIHLIRGYKQSHQILCKFRPQVLFFTGGYVAVPMALAGRKIPSVLFVPDIEPGMALKFLARFADRIALTTAESRSFFPYHRELEVTGYPVRSDLGMHDRYEARRILELAPDLPVLLVFGGSYGARSINRALLAALPRLLESMQVLHISGQKDWSHVKQAKEQLSSEINDSGGLQLRYHAYPYLHDKMGPALAAADLVISRAGASTLGEFPHFGIPAILVPYPHAWRYQYVNAHYLERHGAAVVIEDANLAEQLIETVESLMGNNSRREQMSHAMRSLDRPDAARSIWTMITNLVFGEDRKGTQ